MITIAVCDDAPRVLRDIGGMISRFRPEYGVYTFTSGESLLSGGRTYDIVFLDIEMPGADGMETARRLKERDRGTYIVFLTSHTEYMREAFKVRAYRYLVKPVPEEEFRESIAQAESEILGSGKIVAAGEDRTALIDLERIVCIEAYGDGSIIHTLDGTEISNRSLKYWWERLGSDRFFRVHKSYLAAFAHIKSFDGTTVTLAHMDGPVPLSRRNRSAFKSAFGDYVRKYARYV